MITEITKWISKAVPAPTPKNMSVQVGCHFEEVAEMMSALGMQHHEVTFMEEIATAFKENRYGLLNVNRQELLDSLADQIVTGTGVGYMYKLDVNGACGEVNKSNWSKFVDGEPVFDENGKVKKGPNYFKPDLTKFI
jgi:predicted HAD superfamily Cof-like phosphohydrolase